ncbi:hypothetical protein A1O3_06149 [Capronia epimyces CBS 606.96]|uniref:Aminoglycoside phosphotransferase domain-containing protein n=1 Tax=Capronia epimyces CBS 606.96 TaxID=1182542 RepID=W9XZG3_9EURO|nr:uncharacterized protein A1O3_06149 [Capronia epimyces CBS 606.96]EXJ82336.1 hypothetical protein A1O3_06149 [Capronia epimyces CBS 606.96]
MASIGVQNSIPPQRTGTMENGRRWSDLEQEDDNMLIHMEWGRLQEEFFDYLEAKTRTIETIVAQHLDLGPHQQCRVADRSQWLHGSFNVCVPVVVSNWQAKRVLIRCPLPHRLGGLHTTTLMEEKLRCEAASFAWISENCPRVPIPRLWGFGLPAGMMMEFIEKETGEMLWEMGFPGSEHRRTFFRSFSRILLDLSHPLPKIGSFTLLDSGDVSLRNRPLTKGLAELENESIPTDISRDYCYTATDSYLYDLLHCHALKLRHQPNSTRNDYDTEGQMATIVMLRALLPQFMNRRLRHGPFSFTLTDLHESNIFVNKQYHITSIVDLEWSCSLPIDMQHLPFWLGGDQFDDLYGEGNEEKERQFIRTCEEFLQILEDEAGALSSLSPRSWIEGMRDCFCMKNYWYIAALKIPGAAYNLFIDCLQPQFAPSHSEGEGAIRFQDVVARYWSVDSKRFVEQKSRDRETYLCQLRSAYQPGCH